MGGRAPGQVRDVAGAVADGALGRGGAGSRGEVGQRDEGRGGDGDDDGSLHRGRPGEDEEDGGGPLLSSSVFEGEE